MTRGQLYVSPKSGYLIGGVVHSWCGLWLPVVGVVDTAADITIMEAEAFKRITSVAKLKQCDLKPVDKTYDLPPRWSP